MHRDISPGNLEVTSFHNPKGAIINLNPATREKTSTDHMKGIFSFLALEIMDLKGLNRQKKPGINFFEELTLRDKILALKSTAQGQQA